MFVAGSQELSLLRFSTAGSVDDGKSTLVGRLLHDSGNVYDDHIAALQEAAKQTKSSRVSLALLTDGLKAEREQGITIDVAYRYFTTTRRRFILADSPGHVEYTRNMATGASTVDLTILLVDARTGVIEQTKRHAFIAALLGVPRVLLAVNKMDLVDYAESRFKEIVHDFTEFSAKLGIKEIKFIPVSALEGDNVVIRSTRMRWYTGDTILEHLDTVYISGDNNLVDLRFPVQLVLNPNQNFRGYAGTIASGTMRVGEEVVALPSMNRSRVKSIVRAGKGTIGDYPSEASCKDAVVIQLENQLDISRGDMLVRPGNIPRITSNFEAMVVWLGNDPMSPSIRYLIKHSTRETKASISAVDYKIDIHTLGRIAPGALSKNEIGKLSITTTSPLFLDSYDHNRATGNFILIDPASFQTVAAGMVLNRGRSILGVDNSESTKSKVHFHREVPLVTRAERESRFGHMAITLWMTGLSGSGKSSIAKGAERALFDQGASAYFLDGDNLRQGLNSGLGFSRQDRNENLRRAAEVAAIMNDAGVIVICAFISPFQADRDAARAIIGEDRFIEVHVDAPLETCEERDPHQLYKKARRGEIQNFTGISDPYEAPSTPDIRLETSTLSLPECVESLVELVRKKSSM